MPIIPYGKQTINHSDLSAVSSALTSDLLTTGPKVDEFQESLKKLVGVKHVIAVSNCTNALHLACRILDIKVGDLALTSPITFVASANCIEYCGGKVDFIDIDPNSICISPDLLERYCQENKPPKIVIAVSYRGSIGHLPEIWQLSRKYGFLVIEDAAHSIGTTYTYDDQIYYSGSCQHSHLATFSFHPVKNITTGEGGALLTNDDHLAEKALLLRSHGIERNPAKFVSDHHNTPGYNEWNYGPWYHEIVELGYNYRLTDFAAALGISQLKQLTDFTLKRQTLASRYEELLGESKNITTLKESHDCYKQNICHHIYPILINGGSKTRYHLFHYLQEHGIRCQIHYIPVYWQPYYRNKYRYPLLKCKQAVSYYERTLSLPLFPGLSISELERIIRHIQKFFSEYEE